MPWTGTSPNQTVQRTDGTRSGTQVWQQADGAGVDIISTDHDTHDQDLAAMINLTLKRDGGNTATNNIPFGGFRPTNVGDAQALTEFLTARQRFANVGSYIGTVGGTANAITLTSGFFVPAYASGQTFAFLVASTNSGAVTIALDGLAAKALFRNGGTTAVQSGDLVAGAMAEVIYDGTRFQLNSTAQVGVSSDVLARSLPVGAILMWPHETVPGGYAWLNGAAISRTGNPECFALIGTRFGSGDGSTTFNLPDWRGYAPRNYDDTALVDVDAAARTDRGDGTGGNVVGAKQQDEIKQHLHAAGTLVANSAGDHAHPFKFSTGLTSGTASSTYVLNIDANSGNANAGTQSAGAHTHTISGSTANTGGNETRGKTVNPKFIMLVNPAQAAAGTLGVGGLHYVFDTGTSDADPGAGKLRLNNATIASATAVFISETDAVGSPLQSVLMSIPANSMVYVTKVGAPSTYFAFTTSATPTDGGAYEKFTSLTYVGGNGTFANGDNLVVLVMRSGAAGASGPAGATGGSLDWTFTTASTADSDPGAGIVKANNATPASVTQFYFDDNDRFGNSQVNELASWDDSTSSGSKGKLLILNVATPANRWVYSVTAYTAATGYRKITVEHVSGTAAFASVDYAFLFVPRGDKGTDGAGAGDFVGPASSADNELVLFNGITGKLGKRATTTGVIKATSGVIDAAVAGTDIVVPGGALGTPSSGTLTNATGLPVSGITASTSAAIGVGSIELGHATDTTLSRSAAGELAVEGTRVAKVGKQTIWMPASSMIPRTTNGPASVTTELATNDVMLATLDFDTTTEEGAGFWIAFPKSWNLSTVTYQAYWTAASGSGGVAFGLAGYSFSDDDAMDTAVSGQQIVTDTLIVANDLHISAESSAITIGGTPAANDNVYFEITREVANGSDTLAVDAKLLGIRLFYTTSASTDA